jgi:PST family polysaccharide transporter
MSFQRELVNNFVKIGVLKYSGFIVSFVGSALVSRQLTPDEYGYQAIGALFYGVVALFLDVGLSLAIIREVDALPFQKSVRLIALVVGAALGGLLIIAAYPIAMWYQDMAVFFILILYGICTFFNSLPIVHEAILSRRERFGLIAKVALLATILQVVITYGLALAGFSYYSLILPLLLIPLLKLGVFRKHVALGLDKVSLKELPMKATIHRIKSLVVNLSIFQALVYTSSNVDNLYLSRFHSKADLGLYNRAYNFNRLPLTIISGVISTIQLPMFERIRAEGQNVKAEFTQYIHLLGGIAFPAVVVFHLFSYDISALIWGEEWREVGRYLYPLSIMLPVSLMVSACGNLFVVFRGERFLVYNSLVSSFAQIAGASIGILFSIKGMIIGIIIGTLFGTLPITMYLGFYRLFGYSPKEIAGVWWFNVLSAISLLVCYIWENEEWTYVILGFYCIGSAINIVKYVKRNYT